MMMALAQATVSCVSIGPTGAPRVEIGDILEGRGAVFTVVDHLLVFMERSGPRECVAGPFLVDAGAERELFAALERELSWEDGHLDPEAVREVIDHLVRRVGPCAEFPCRPQSWDEANADIC
jgi:hypothetical protein